MTSEPSKESFRCRHHHTATSHPNCYLEFLNGGKSTSKPKRSAKILLLDIETLPGEYYAFDPKVEYLTPDKQIKDWSISCWSAKWLFDKTIMGEAVSPQEAYDRNDGFILSGIWKLMNEADVIVTHNGIKFDIKKLYAKFIEHSFIPPAKSVNVDTCKVAKEVFGFTYNRLDELGQKFGIGKKIEMHFDDWKQCLTNDKSAKKYLNNMLTYCKQDISPLLEDVYLVMLPYISNHPNMNVFSNLDTDVCRNCESSDLDWNSKPYYTPQGLWDGWRCKTCGATGRGTGAEHKIVGTTVV